MSNLKRNPNLRFTWVTFGAALALAFLAWRYVKGLDPILAWLAAVTVVAFLAYGYDKVASGKEWARVPEKVLLGLSFTGGTVGALAGMHFFRHKTVKRSFRLKFWFLFFLQAALVAAFYLMRSRHHW